MLKRREQRYSHNLMRLQVHSLRREMQQQEPHRNRMKMLEPQEPHRNRMKMLELHEPQPEQNYIDLYSFHGVDSEIHCNHHRQMHNRLGRMEKPLRETLQKQRVVIQWQEPHHIRKEMLQWQELNCIHVSLKLGDLRDHQIRPQEPHRNRKVMLRP